MLRLFGIWLFWCRSLSRFWVLGNCLGAGFLGTIWVLGNCLEAGIVWNFLLFWCRSSSGFLGCLGSGFSGGPSSSGFRACGSSSSGFQADGPLSLSGFGAGEQYLFSLSSDLSENVNVLNGRNETEPCFHHFRGRFHPLPAKRIFGHFWGAKMKTGAWKCNQTGP